MEEADDTTGEAGGTTEEDLKHPMLLLFRQQPSAIQKLTQWMKRWGEMWVEKVPESFERICQQARDEAAQRDIR